MDASLPEKPYKKYFLIALAVIFGISFIALNIMVYTYGKAGKPIPILSSLKKTIPTPPPIPTITPTPFPINRHGRMPFTLMTQTSGPRVVEGWVDPFDVKRGNQQRLAIYITDDNGGINEVSGVWKTDTKEKFVTFSRVSGSTMEGWWEGAWECDDTINYDLKITITMINANGPFTQLITLR